MSTRRRHLRFLISSALLIGPLACSGPETEANTVAPTEEPLPPPTGNPAGPEPEPPIVAEQEVAPLDEDVEEPTVNERDDEETPSPPPERPPRVNTRPER